MELKKLTVWINNKFQEILLKNAKVTGKGDVDIDLSQTPKANMYLVCACTWLSEEEVNEWSPEEFQEILDKINKTKKTEKKS